MFLYVREWGVEDAKIDGYVEVVYRCVLLVVGVVELWVVLEWWCVVGVGGVVFVVVGRLFVGGWWCRWRLMVVCGGGVGCV